MFNKNMQGTLQLRLRRKEPSLLVFNIVQEILSNWTNTTKRNEVEILERNRQSDTKFAVDMITWKIHM